MAAACASAMAYMVPYIRDKKSWPKPPDVMYDANWPMRQASLLFAGRRVEAAGLHRPVVVAARRFGRRGSHPQLLRPAAAAVVRLATLAVLVVWGVSGFWTSRSIGLAQGAAARTATLKSPDGHIAFELRTSATGPLTYRITRDGIAALDWSPAGIVIDGANITERALESDRAVPGSTNEDYPTRGVHAVAHNRSNNGTFSFQQAGSGARFSLQVRAFNDGVGFRFVVPGDGTRTPDEATAFRLPAGSMTWTHDLHGHYESMYVKRVIEDVPSGDWAAPPVTYKLPGNGGYASITESALTAYAGMALQADGRGGYAARLGHAHPVSYPYALRYKAEDVLRLALPAKITGTIQTPWRVILVSKDLNGLVNNDIIHNLAPPPDPALFPQGQATPWIRPGRAVWRYLDGGDNTYEGLKGFTELAATLGFEHHVVEGVWRQWTPAQLKAVCRSRDRASRGDLALEAQHATCRRPRRGASSSTCAGATAWLVRRSTSSITKRRKSSISTMRFCARRRSTA